MGGVGRKMKIVAKTFAIILVFIMLLALVACKGETPNDKDAPYLLFPLVACSTNRQGLNLDANNVTKIELLSPTHPATGSLNEQVWVES